MASDVAVERAQVLAAQAPQRRRSEDQRRNDNQDRALTVKTLPPLSSAVKKPAGESFFDDVVGAAGLVDMSRPTERQKQRRRSRGGVEEDEDFMQSYEERRRRSLGPEAQAELRKQNKKGKEQQQQHQQQQQQLQNPEETILAQQRAKATPRFQRLETTGSLGRGMGETPTPPPPHCSPLLSDLSEKGKTSKAPIGRAAFGEGKEASLGSGTTSPLSPLSPLNAAAAGGADAGKAADERQLSGRSSALSSKLVDEERQLLQSQGEGERSREETYAELLAHTRTMALGVHSALTKGRKRLELKNLQETRLRSQKRRAELQGSHMQESLCCMCPKCCAPEKVASRVPGGAAAQEKTDRREGVSRGGGLRASGRPSRGSAKGPSLQV